MGKEVGKLEGSEEQPQSGNNELVLELIEMVAEIEEQESLVVGPEQPQSGSNELILELAELAAEIEVANKPVESSEKQPQSDGRFLKLAKMATEMGMVKSIG